MFFKAKIVLALTLIGSLNLTHAAQKNTGLSEEKGLLNTSTQSSLSSHRLFPSVKALAPLSLQVGLTILNTEEKIAGSQFKRDSLNGFTLTTLYRWSLKKNYSTSSYFNYLLARTTADNVERNLEEDESFNLHQFLIGQTINYQFDMANYILEPFASLGLGFGRIHHHLVQEESGEGAQNLEVTQSGGAFAYEVGAGVNLDLKNGIIPFFKVAYRKLSIDEVDIEVIEDGASEKRDNVKLIGKNRIDTDGLQVTFGIGANF